MNAIVYHTGSELVKQAAKSVESGATDAGLQPDFIQTNQSLDPTRYDLLLLVTGVFGLGGVDEKITHLLKNSTGKRACIVMLHSGRGKQALESLANTTAQNGAVVSNTVLIEVTGLGAFFGKGKLTDADLARAYALGEKAAMDALGKRPEKNVEKQRIKGYKK